MQLYEQGGMVFVKTLALEERSGLMIEARIPVVQLLSSATDSTGAPLPTNFESLPQTLVPSANGPTSISYTDGTNTWTQTRTYDGSGRLTNVSAWVKS